MPPIQLVYGYGVMFKVSCEDLKSHLGERRPWMRGSVFDLDYLALFCKDRDQILEASDEENEDQISKENDTLIQKENTIQRSTSEAIETIDFESDAEFPDTQIDAQHESQLEEESCTTNKSTDFKVGDKEAAAAVVVEKKGKTIETPFIQRGRKTRTKKLNRYKDQDEEEKALMLDLLGCDKGPQPKGKRAKNAAKNAAILQQKNEDFEKRKAAKIKAQYEKEGELLENKSSILLPGVDGRVKKHVFDWTTLDYLTGNPLLSDNLQNAIIVGGPWQSLQKFKYKVKLIPGSTKRGKAATSAIQGINLDSLFAQLNYLCKYFLLKQQNLGMNEKKNS